MSYSGNFVGTVTGTGWSWVEFTTENHYPGDPNFAGSFQQKMDCELKLLQGDQGLATIENGRIIRFRYFGEEKK